MMSMRVGNGLHDLLADLMHDVTGLRVGAETTFDEIGLESLSVVSFTRRLDAFFPDLPAAFLFDCRSLADVAAYLEQRYPAQSQTLVSNEDLNSAGREIPKEPEGEESDDDWHELDVIPIEACGSAAAHQDIAIVGMQGRFPGAINLDVFWQNLQGGVDAVTEIPPDRWSLEGFYSQETGGRDAGRSYCKWGAFLANVELFDAMFFGIAAREAALIDPQERIFLQAAWQAMESAGLLGERAADLKRSEGLDVGVFLGLTTNTYLLRGPGHWRRGRGEIPTSMPWSAANRVSYCLDLCGPSLTVDTACSSSLVAIHLACESLKKGECAAAIAGGVNLYLHPAKYIQLCQHQMLSPSGRCHSFGAEADGFAPGEGVGVLVLKRMQDAVRDNDRILAVIRGTAVNHNGRTNGYTVPRARSQSSLLRNALREGDVPGDSITYVEAHGTGTKLGDPIEVMGLVDVLGSRDVGPCGLGSVKSNIGHLESAAGVAGVIKTVLQLQHRTLTPSLHSDPLNPALELEATRFFVPQKTQPWNTINAYPRRAGVSSFGAGGTNGHVVLEEAPDGSRSAPVTGPLVFPLSARTQTSLERVAKSLLALVENAAAAQQFEFLPRLAYTLQCGRRHFEHRAAFVANERLGLAEQIKSYLQNAGTSANNRAPYQGHVTEPERPSPMSGDVRPDALAKRWSAGEAVSWQGHWHPETPVPIAAPLYEFEEERHWLDEPVELGPDPVVLGVESAQERTFDIPTTSSIFQQHQIGGRPLLPATACIAHVHSLALQSALNIELTDLAWMRPISASDGKHVSIAFSYRNLAEKIQFECSQQSDGKVCFSGHAAAIESTDARKADKSLDRARSRCSEKLDVAACYRKFERAGMIYGPRFRCLAQVWRGDAEVVARLVVRDEGRAGDVMTPLDPAMMDAALHAANFLLGAEDEDFDAPLVPVEARRVRIHGLLSSEAFSVIRLKRSEENGETCFDVRIYAPDGTLLIEMEEFRFRHLARTRHHDTVGKDLVTLRPDWAEVQRGVLQGVAACSNILFGVNSTDWKRLAALAPDVTSSTRAVLDGASFEVRDEYVQWDSSQPQHSELLWRALWALDPAPERLLFVIDPRSDQSFARDGFHGAAAKGSALEAIEIIRSFCVNARSRRVHASVLVQSDTSAGTGLGPAVGGLLRSIQLEMPTLSASVIEIADEDWLSAVAAELRTAPTAGVTEIRRLSGRCFEHRIVPVAQSGILPEFSSEDVVVVTGATGALGKRLAQFLGRKGVGALALLSRRQRDSEIESALSDLRRRGVKAEYWQADCADEHSLGHAIAEISARLGPVTGVLHCAGVLQDGFFVRQTLDDLREACRAKVQGAYWLDQLTIKSPLKWFVVSSALAGIRGNVGQSHYALANSWLDRFSEHRARNVSLGNRRGQSISIAWPFWDTREGMQASKLLLSTLAKAGVAPIDDADGEAIFLRALSETTPIIIPVKGDRDAVLRFIDLNVVPTSGPGDTNPTTVSNDASSMRDAFAAGCVGATESEVVEQSLLEFLKSAFHDVTGADPSRIDPDAPMEVFGLDSIMVMELNTIIGQRFPSASKTAAFEARSLRALGKMLHREHPGDAEKFVPAARSTDGEPAVGAHREKVEAVGPDKHSGDVRSTDIAIIGLAGQYPGGRTLNDFWRNLASGRDLVGVLPNRWRSAPFGFGSAEQDERLYARWGSFLEDFDKFDPLFFGISPRDAERMDPQERLFLQAAWHAVEDAGYTPEMLSGSRDDPDSRRRVGVIAGVMYGEYQFYGAGAERDVTVPLTSSSYASIANRVSFCLDLDGPSFAVDSMCSSSLYAIHLACDLIKSGGCELAIAGGVNLSLHPYKYRTLCELNFASTDGKCRSFGEGGDGYVPGEGVGAVLLKPALAAIRDKDHIYGVIRGSDIGHGGRGSGYTVPNAEAQADVVRRAVARAGVEQTRLSYIEAHGTGTSLGDPIEVRGLGKALSELAGTGHKCAIGSVKSNIGHLESAAGVAGLTKVLLQLKHRQIAPSLHATELNKNIDFDSTPFAVQTTLSDWVAPDGKPRVAALSSFGAGGSNAHLVIEEYCPPAETASFADNDEIFVFSARTWKQLATALQNFSRHLDVEGISRDARGATLGERGYQPVEVATTLLYGRRANRCRCAIIASNFVDLQEIIDACHAHLERHRVSTMVRIGERAFLGEALVQSTQNAEPLSLRETAERWVAATWAVPEAPIRVRKVPLPGYAFDRQSYWIFDLTTEENVPKTGGTSEARVVELPARPQILTPEAIIQKVERGELDISDAQVLLQSIIATEAAE